MGILLTVRKWFGAQKGIEMLANSCIMGSARSILECRSERKRFLISRTISPFYNLIPLLRAGWLKACNSSDLAKSLASHVESFSGPSDFHHIEAIPHLHPSRYARSAPPTCAKARQWTSARNRLAGEAGEVCLVERKQYGN